MEPVLLLGELCVVCGVWCMVYGVWDVVWLPHRQNSETRRGRGRNGAATTPSLIQCSREPIICVDFPHNLCTVIQGKKVLVRFL